MNLKVNKNGLSINETNMGKLINILLILWFVKIYTEYIKTLENKEVREYNKNMLIIFSFFAIYSVFYIKFTVI